MRGSSPRVRGKRVDAELRALFEGLIPARAGKTGLGRGRASAVGAHPRACGENPAHDCGDAQAAGSSPRVRGKPHGSDRGCSGGGLIPARAGKTDAPLYASQVFPAHPRACGENLAGVAGRAASAGSSPRVRGKRRRRRSAHRHRRLIPARAGKTLDHALLERGGGAHPRACGENATSPPSEATSIGSSPRVRGKLPCRPERRGSDGLIPARAGKTGSSSRAGTSSPAHPRACGENGQNWTRRTRPRGSSPRVRGKRGQGIREHHLNRLIPARAGKTPVHSRKAAAHRAHPRACGENIHAAPIERGRAGSSPRVRGKHPIPVDGLNNEGLIPARAGKTRPRTSATRSSGAHPRACGENGRYACGVGGACGSSPRVRGKRGQALGGGEFEGLIPARAGKTVLFFAGRGPGWAHPRACGENAS